MVPRTVWMSARGYDRRNDSNMTNCSPCIRGSKGAWQWKPCRKHKGEGGGGKRRGDQGGEDDKGKVGAGENGDAAGGTDIVATATGFNPSLGHGEEGGEGRTEKQSLNEQKLESIRDDEDDIEVEVRKRARKRKYNGDRAKKDH